MEHFDRILELSDKLSGIQYSFLVLFFLSLISITFILVMVLIVMSEEYKFDVGTVVFGLITVALASTTLYMIVDRTSMKAEYMELSEQSLASIETTAVLKTNDIVNSIPVQYWFCPHVELKEDEKCTYLEFLSEGDITQLFIPLNKSVYANADKALEITYYDLSKEEREFLNEYLAIEYRAISGKHEIYPNGWSLGLSIKK